MQDELAVTLPLGLSWAEFSAWRASALTHSGHRHSTGSIRSSAK